MQIKAAVRMGGDGPVDRPVGGEEGGREIKILMKGSKRTPLGRASQWGGLAIEVFFLDTGRINGRANGGGKGRLFIKGREAHRERCEKPIHADTACKVA